MIPEIIIYLLKANFVLLLFLAGYYFILRKYTFYTLNRFYLLLGLIYSAIYPLIDLQALLNNTQVLRQQMSGIHNEWQVTVIYVMGQAESTNSNLRDLILLIFWSGAIFMIFRLIIRLISLFKLHRRSPLSTSEGFTFRKINGNINPFSFWKTIYLNPENHHSAELPAILKHEQVHIRQLHTCDVLLAEIGTVFYWFNPAAWLFKKAIRANLEFITDQEVIHSGMDSKAYQYALLKINTSPQKPWPVNHFHILTIKQRIAMINKQPSRRISQLSYLLIIPLMLLSVLIAGTSTASLNNSTVANVIERLPLLTEPGKIPVSDRQIQEAAGAVQPDLSLPEQSISPADTNKISIRVKNESAPASGIIIRSLNSTDSLKKGEADYFVNHVRTNHVDHIKSDSISSIHVMVNPEGRKTISILTKGQAGNTTRLPGLAKTDHQGDQAVSFSFPQSDITNMLINGEKAGMADLRLLTPESIESIHVFKGNEAVTRYGEEARGGIVVIKTKE